MTLDGFYRVCFAEGRRVVVAHFNKLELALRYVEKMGEDCAFDILTPDGQRLSDVLRAR